MRFGFTVNKTSCCFDKHTENMNHKFILTKANRNKTASTVNNL